MPRTTANKEHSALFRSRSIATALLAPLLSRAFDKLEKLHDQGKIPNTTIPVFYSGGGVGNYSRRVTHGPLE